MKTSTSGARTGRLLESATATRQLKCCSALVISVPTCLNGCRRESSEVLFRGQLFRNGVLGTVRRCEETRLDTQPYFNAYAWSARDPLVPLCEASAKCQQADEGVGRGPGGPPHHAMMTAK